jgi:hypothetical protein
MLTHFSQKVGKTPVFAECKFSVIFQKSAKKFGKRRVWFFASFAFSTCKIQKVSTQPCVSFMQFAQ